MPQDFEVRGETVMPQKAFEKMNEEREAEGLTAAVNPRNAAAGTLRTWSRHGGAAAAGCVCVLSAHARASTLAMGQEETLDALTAMGFRVNPHRGRVHTVEEMMKFIRLPRKRGDAGLRHRRRRFQSGCAATRLRLGYTGRAPRWAIA